MSVKMSDCIAPHFHDLHLDLKEGVNTEYWLRGGRGSCKSSFVSLEIILGILKDPEANAVIFRRFENEIGDTVYSQLEWAADKLGVYNLFTWYKSPRKIMHNETRQLILFKGADNPKKLKSIKLAKGCAKYVWFEEVDQFGGIFELRNILQSVFRGTTKTQIAFYSYNPPKSARSWVNAESKTPKEGRVVHYSDYRTVPPEWLGETFLANAEHLKNTNEDAYKHEYLGEETGTGLEVFNNVTLRQITDKEISLFDYIYQGLDFGFAADPLCFGLQHYDAKKRKLYLFKEISGIGIKNSAFAAMLTDEERVEVTIADSAELKSIAELREDHKVNIVAAEKSPGSVDQGIKWLQDLDEIVIDPIRCPLAGTEFINYALDVNRFGEVISKYPDRGNHSIDQVRYAMSRQIIETRKERLKSKFKVRALPIVNRW